MIVHLAAECAGGVRRTMPCSPFMLKEIASFAGGAHPFLRVGVGRAVGPLRGVLGLGARFAFELVVVLVREVVRFVPHGTFPP